jgi:hypothetical protein
MDSLTTMDLATSLTFFDDMARSIGINHAYTAWLYFLQRDLIEIEEGFIPVLMVSEQG